MKTKYVQLISLAAATVAATLLATGCASTGYDKGNITAANIQSASDRIAALPGQIDATLASLNGLVTQPQADLRPQYKEFAANVADVESAAKDLAASRSNLAARQKEFFAKWDEELAQIQNPDIKARSQGRKEQVSQQLMTIKTSYAQADIVFKPFLADLQDVQKYLSVDLTASGIAAIKDPVAKASQDAVPLKASLTKLAGDFKALGDAMSSVTPPPAPQ
jgi:hypothetical protein